MQHHRERSQDLRLRLGLSGEMAVGGMGNAVGDGVVQNLQDAAGLRGQGTGEKEEPDGEKVPVRKSDAEC